MKTRQVRTALLTAAAAVVGIVIGMAGPNCGVPQFKAWLGRRIGSDFEMLTRQGRPCPAVATQAHGIVARHQARGGRMSVGRRRRARRRANSC